MIMAGMRDQEDQAGGEDTGAEGGLWGREGRERRERTDKQEGLAKGGRIRGGCRGGGRVLWKGGEGEQGEEGQEGDEGGGQCVVAWRVLCRRRAVSRRSDPVSGRRASRVGCRVGSRVASRRVLALRAAAATAVRGAVVATAIGAKSRRSGAPQGVRRDGRTGHVAFRRGLVAESVRRMAWRGCVRRAIVTGFLADGRSGRYAGVRSARARAHARR